MPDDDDLVLVRGKGGLARMLWKDAKSMIDDGSLKLEEEDEEDEELDGEDDDTDEEDDTA